MMKILVPLLVAALMVAAGIISIAFLGWSPSYECAEPGTVSSGFIDDDLGCPITQESFDAALRDEPDLLWNRIIGAALIFFAPAVAGILWLIGRRSSGSKKEPSPVPTY